MKEIITIKSKKLDYIYERWDSEIKEYPNMKLIAYVIHDGYKIFEIRASYAKHLKPTKYYVLAKNIKEAKQIFKLRYTWLDIISSVTECSEEITNLIINNPMKYVVS